MVHLSNNSVLLDLVIRTMVLGHRSVMHHHHDQDQGLEEEVEEGKQLLLVRKLSWKKKQQLKEKPWQQLQWQIHLEVEDLLYLEVQVVVSLVVLCLVLHHLLTIQVIHLLVHEEFLLDPLIQHLLLPLDPCHVHNLLHGCNHQPMDQGNIHEELVPWVPIQVLEHLLDVILFPVGE